MYKNSCQYCYLILIRYILKVNKANLWIQNEGKVRNLNSPLPPTNYQSWLQHFRHYMMRWITC